MERVLIAVGIAVAVAVLAWVLERRRPEAPTQRRWAVPDQLDRADFDRPGAPWLVAVFSSETCDSCQAAVERARLLATADVAVQEIEVAAHGDLHRRYNVEAVPTLVVADRQGVVRASIVGPPGTDELEDALAEVLGSST
jgi:protein-disulfide isomerase